MCDFCEEYRYGTIQAKQKEDVVSTEIGVKMCTYTYKKANKNIPPSSLLSRIFPLNYCPVCGSNLAIERDNIEIDYAEALTKSMQNIDPTVLADKLGCFESLPDSAYFKDFE